MPLSLDPYARAGVDIAAGNDLVEAIKPFARSTARSGTTASLGGFGALFDLKAAGYDDPLLVSTTDGVGTKVKIAIEANEHSTIGTDLVAMCVNDLVVQGAEPLLFMDYFATGKLDKVVAKTVIKGIADACAQSGCALVGGETAEMPGLYAPGDYDLAGFAVGAVARDKLLPRIHDVAVDDIVLGLPSVGLHSNGFSLARKIIADEGCRLDLPAPFNSSNTLAKELLTPTRLYVKPALALAKAGLVTAMANITGGGLIENIPRVLPDGFGVMLDANRWPLLPVFTWLVKMGALGVHDMARTFNAGIGFVLIVKQENLDKMRSVLHALDEPVLEIGRVFSAIESTQDSTQRVIIENAQSAWKIT